jgi:hypothetical protein
MARTNQLEIWLLLLLFLPDIPVLLPPWQQHGA